MDIKRIGFLLVLSLMVGLVQVHFRTARMQSVYELTSLREKEGQLRQTLGEQQARLSALIESPDRVKAQVAKLGLMVLPPGSEQEILELRMTKSE
jgi:hypothetical protein